MKNLSDYFWLIGDKFRKFAVPFVILGMILSLIPLAQCHFNVRAMRTALNLFYRPTASYVIFLWFIYVLFEFYLLAPFISGAYNQSIIIFLPASILLALYPIHSDLFALHLFSRHFLFLILGIIAAENIQVLRHLPRFPVYLAACFFLYLSYFHPGLLYPASGLLALPFMLALSWIGASLLQPYHAFIEMISKNCFGIYLFQMIAIQILAKAFAYFPTPSTLFPLFLIIVIPFSIGFSFVVIRAISFLTTRFLQHAVH